MKYRNHNIILNLPESLTIDEFIQLLNRSFDATGLTWAMYTDDYDLKDFVDFQGKLLLNVIYYKRAIANI